MSDDAKTKAQLEFAQHRVLRGVYKHWKGGFYIVHGDALLESTLVHMVHYWSIERETPWERTRQEFFESVPEAGGRCRFVFARKALKHELLVAAGFFP
jgi:hypothetical protein